MKKLYACDNCGYVFVVESPERRCPDCGSLVIREAFQQEKSIITEVVKQQRSDNLWQVSRKFSGWIL